MEESEGRRRGRSSGAVKRRSLSFVHSSERGEETKEKKREKRRRSATGRGERKGKPGGQREATRQQRSSHTQLIVLFSPPAHTWRWAGCGERYRRTVKIFFFFFLLFPSRRARPAFPFVCHSESESESESKFIVTNRDSLTESLGTALWSTEPHAAYR